jgi:hypothetical protein
LSNAVVSEQDPLVDCDQDLGESDAPRPGVGHHGVGDAVHPGGPGRNWDARTGVDEGVDEDGAVVGVVGGHLDYPVRGKEAGGLHVQDAGDARLEHLVGPVHGLAHRTE